MRAIAAITPKNNLTTQPPKNKTIIDDENNPNSPNYVDPLAKWPVRGLAYSNELGVAIGEIAPKLGGLLWVPALMYFGADIYDKYKNQETSYNPSGRRGLEQATFQALASVILPTVAVHLGQKSISGADRFTKNKISTNAKEETLKFILDFINKSKLSNFENNMPEYKNKFITSFNNYISDTAGEHHSKSLFKRIVKWAFTTKHPESLAKANQEHLLNYAEKQLDEIIAVRSSLMNKERPKGMSDKIYNKFNNIQQAFKKEYGADHYLHKSAKYGMKEQLNSKIFKLKMFKTLGGFIALGALITPIDIFVEKTVMKKVVEPNFDRISGYKQMFKGQKGI